MLEHKIDIKREQAQIMENRMSNDFAETEHEKARITQAVDHAIENYIRSRKKMVPAFVKQHFSFKGSLSLHKKALGQDLYLGPLNIIWAFPYTISSLLASGLGALGWKKARETLQKLPKGFETHVQKEVKRLIYMELLELPYSAEGVKSEHDALLDEILAQPDIQNLVSTQLSHIHKKSLRPGFRTSLEKKIRDYTINRTVAEDVSGSIITLSVGYAVFHKASFGALSTGVAVASEIAQKTAIDNFWLGHTVGSWYYSIFPATPGRYMVFVSTASTMALLAILTTFSGILTDPLQTRLGIHQKRLKKLIRSLEHELKGEQKKQYQLKEDYVARVFDIIDLLRTAAGV